MSTELMRFSINQLPMRLKYIKTFLGYSLQHKNYKLSVLYHAFNCLFCPMEMVYDEQET